MAKKVSISGEYLDIEYIVKYKNDLDNAIKYYHKNSEEFFAFTKEEMNQERRKKLREIEINTIFMLLSSIEAWIRVDYEFRVRKKQKDDLSRELRRVDKNIDKTYKISIEKLCDIYKQYITGNIFSQLKSAFKLRHWIAHGRYWTLKIKKYDFDEVYQLAYVVYSLNSKELQT